MSESAVAVVDDDSGARVGAYSVLAALLSAPPGGEALEALLRVEDDGESSGEMGGAWRGLRRAAVVAAREPAAVVDEYHALFIGMGRGELVPYGSWHLTGFLMEQPLSDLRDDLRALGLARGDGGGNAHDPEDHIAALCEAMALIIGADDIDEARQRAFYRRHLGGWAGEFFGGLAEAESARFYRAVGVLGRCFMALENEYLDVDAG